MKKSLILIMFFTAATITAFGQSKTKFSLKNFKKLPPELLRYDSLAKYISPDKSYTYWEYDEGHWDTTRSGPVLFSRGAKPLGLVIKDPRGSLLAGCLPAFCYKYIAYVRNGKVGYITNNKDLVTFMGKINTVAEAMLLALVTDDVYPDENKAGGAYRVTPTGFKVIMTRSSLCPQSKQGVQYIFNADGIIKKIDRRVFDKQGGCAVI